MRYLILGTPAYLILGKTQFYKMDAFFLFQKENTMKLHLHLKTDHISYKLNIY